MKRSRNNEWPSICFSAMSGVLRQKRGALVTPWPEHVVRDSPSQVLIDRGTALHLEENIPSMFALLHSHS